MPHQSFKRAQGKAPVTFDLWDKDDNPVTYHCIPSLPVGTILDFGRIMTSNEDNESDVLSAITNLFQTALEADEWDKFQAAIHDKDLGIDINTLTDVAMWLADTYADRPTGAPSEPGSDRTTSGINSTDGALPEVQTYSRSELTAPSL